MAKNCVLCSEKIEKHELDKLQGGVIKIKNSDNINEFYYVCSLCQKKHKNNLKKEVEKQLSKK